MTKVGFISSSPAWHWERQFPESMTVWDGVEFVFSGDFADCDLVVVFDAIPEDLGRVAFVKRSLFVASEPASVKVYDPDFLAQFDCVLTTDGNTTHPKAVYGQVGLPWHAGAWNSAGELLRHPMVFRDFESFRPAKSKSLSVVASNKTYTDGHRARLDFVQELKRYFGDEIDVFGRNINGFGDKTDVLSAYRYHIAIENSSYLHYWTEKLSDAFLTLTYPIYYGCPNIADYFAPQSLTQIDIHDADRSISIIKRLLESDEAERSAPLLEEARQRVLWQHNLFAILSKLAVSMGHRPAHRHDLETERSFKRRSHRVKRLVRKKISKIYDWLAS